jgi:hypothetical protein
LFGLVGSFDSAKPTLKPWSAKAFRSVGGDRMTTGTVMTELRADPTPLLEEFFVRRDAFGLQTANGRYQAKREALRPIHF